MCVELSRGHSNTPHAHLPFLAGLSTMLFNTIADMTHKLYCEQAYTGQMQCHLIPSCLTCLQTSAYICLQAPETGLPAPDLVLYLRLPHVETAAQRGGYGEER